MVFTHGLIKLEINHRNVYWCSTIKTSSQEHTALAVVTDCQGLNDFVGGQGPLLCLLKRPVSFQ